MKNRAMILNISLAILLVVSLAGNLILFNKFNTIKGLQNELETSRAELQNAQLDWETLETDLAEAQEENVRLVALKDGSSATLSSTSLPDPNKILKSGKTLLEAKIMIEEQMDSFRKSGYNDEARLNKAVDMMARDFGTTLDEISRCPNVEVKEQPAQANTQKPSTQKPSNQTPSNSTTNNSASGFRIENGVLIKYTGWDSSVVIPNGVKTIGRAAFEDKSSLTKITIPDSVTRIEPYAFNMCEGLTNLVIPNSVTSIGEGAFSSCDGLTGVVVPNSVTNMEDDVFYGCDNLKSVTLSANVKTIKGSTFAHCESLNNVTIPNGVKSIESHAFFNCTNLTSIRIPSSVVSIDEDAFNYSQGMFRAAGEEAKESYVILKTIYGATNSYAETYAKANNIEFKNMAE